MLFLVSDGYGVDYLPSVVAVAYFFPLPLMQATMIYGSQKWNIHCNITPNDVT